MYGITKVFGELLGRFYRRKYGLDFRGIRYPGIVGPGVTTWSLAQCTCWVIERIALGQPFTVPIARRPRARRTLSLTLRSSSALRPELGFGEPERRFELLTCSLRMSCSTD